MVIDKIQDQIKVRLGSESGSRSGLECAMLTGTRISESGAHLAKLRELFKELAVRCLRSR